MEPSFTRRTSTAACSTTIKVCFFCNKSPTDKENLHDVATLEIEQRIHDGAAVLGRQDLLVKMVIGDLVAQEASYHKNCLSGFHNQVQSNERKMKIGETGFLNLAFTELVMYMES